MSGLSFRHISPPSRVYCGPPALAALPAELDRVGAKRVLLVHGRSIGSQTELLGQISESLGARMAGQFDGVVAQSPISAVEAAARAVATCDADALISIGGGSAVVTARAANILVSEGRDLRELATHRDPSGKLVSPKLSRPKLPHLIVPSTPTTAFAKAGCAVWDPEHQERLALFDPKTRAQGVLMAPSVALTSPAWLVLGAALNAFSMSVESLESDMNDPLAEAMLAHALRLLLDGLPRLMQDPGDGDTRLRLMLAAQMAGEGSDYAGGGLAQAVSRAAGPLSTAPNGILEAILLPAALHFASAAAGTTERIARALGLPRVAEESVEGRVVGAVDAFLRRLDVPTRLRDAGLSRDALDVVVDRAMDDWTLATAPRKPTRAELAEFLEMVW